MRYKIYAETEETYFIKHYINIYDYKGKNKSVGKGNLYKWENGKINITDYKKIEKRTKQVKKPNIKLSKEEKKVIDPILKAIERYGYIIEKELVVDDLSKAKVKAILMDSKLLKRQGIRRVRANKSIKDDLKVAFKGYPYIIIKNGK